jgi:hypothetical protein
VGIQQKLEKGKCIRSFDQNPANPNVSVIYFTTIVKGLLQIGGVTDRGFDSPPDSLTLFPNLKVTLLSLADSEEVIRTNKEVL